MTLHPAPTISHTPAMEKDRQRRRKEWGGRVAPAKWTHELPWPRVQSFLLWTPQISKERNRAGILPSPNFRCRNRWAAFAAGLRRPLRTLRAAAATRMLGLERRSDAAVTITPAAEAAASLRGFLPSRHPTQGREWLTSIQAMPGEAGIETSAGGVPGEPSPPPEGICTLFF